MDTLSFPRHVVESPHIEHNSLACLPVPWERTFCSREECAAPPLRRGLNPSQSPITSSASRHSTRGQILHCSH